MQHYDELTEQQARLKTKIKARLRMQGVIVSGEGPFSSKGRKAVLAEVKSSAVRTAINQLYAVLDQSMASQTGSETTDAASGPGLSGDQAVAHGAGSWTDLRLSLQCLHSYVRAASARRGNSGSTVG